MILRWKQQAVLATPNDQPASKAASSVASSARSSRPWWATGWIFNCCNSSMTWASGRPSAFHVLRSWRRVLAGWSPRTCRVSRCFNPCHLTAGKNASKGLGQFEVRNAQPGHPLNKIRELRGRQETRWSCITPGASCLDSRIFRFDDVGQASPVPKIPPIYLWCTLAVAVSSVTWSDGICPCSCSYSYCPAGWVTLIPFLLLLLLPPVACLFVLDLELLQTSFSAVFMFVEYRYCCYRVHINIIFLFNCPCQCISKQKYVAWGHLLSWFLTMFISTILVWSLYINKIPRHELAEPSVFVHHPTTFFQPFLVLIKGCKISHHESIY